MFARYDFDFVGRVIVGAFIVLSALMGYAAYRIWNRLRREP